MAESSTPLVSVVMVTYNHEPFIAQAIESVLEQRTSFQIELLVGEDRSTDGTPGIVARYAARWPDRIRVISSEHNVGMHSNHARLVREARGAYVAYCDGDDYWSDPLKLARQVDTLAADASLAGVHTDFAHLMWGRDSWRLAENHRVLLRRPIPETLTTDQLLVENVVQTCTLMLRSRIAKDYVASTWASQRFAVEDWPLTLFATTRGGLRHLPVVTAVYRTAPGSVTNSGHRANFDRILDQIRMAEEAVQILDVDPRAAALAKEVSRSALNLTAMQSGDASLVARALQIPRFVPHAKTALPLTVRAADAAIRNRAARVLASRWLARAQKRLAARYRPL